MSKRFDTVMDALERGERDAQLLSQRNFDARYWRNARRQMNVIRRELETAKSRNEAYAAVLSAMEGTE